MNIEELLEIINALGGQATIDAICKVFQKKWGMYPDSSFKTGVQNILAANPDFVRYNKVQKQWEVGTDPETGNKYLYVSDPKTFQYLADVMKEVFGFKKVKSQCGYFDIDDNYAAWFPQYWNEDWDNRYSEDGRYWYEKPNDGHMTGLERKLRYVFAHDKFGTKRNVYKFTGLFKNIEIREDGTRVYEIVDDKVLIKGKTIDTSSLRKMLVCNITYMKRYNGITEDDVIVGGGGSYPTENNDCGEKYNFHVNEDGRVRGFVETLYIGGKEHMGDFNYAKDMLIENIDPQSKGRDAVEGVRVVFISKGPNNDKNVVVGWYDNAIVYRKRQMSAEQFGFNMECSATDAHLIPEDERTFEYPKKNEDGTYNFGQSNISYPRLFKQEATSKLVDNLNNYLDGRLVGERRFFFRPTIVSTWNYFTEKGNVGDEETFSGTSDMKIGDYLLIYVGKKDNDKEAGIYALAEIVKEPFINDNEEDVSFGKLAVKAKYLIVSDEVIIPYEKTIEMAKQIQNAHLIEDEYYAEIKNFFNI